MGQTLIRGLITSGVVSKDQIWAGDKSASACAKAAEKLSVAVEADFQHRIPTADLILICVNPADVPSVLAGLRNTGLRRDTLLISILAGCPPIASKPCSGLTTRWCARCRIRRPSWAKA